jgi:glycosyltransferase involved in cell wall biosynthesis
MRVLYVTNMYPTERNPVFGIFVKEQMVDAARYLDLTQDLYFMNGVEKGWKEYLRSLTAVRRKIERGNYDLVHIHFGLSGLWRLFYRPGVPVLLSLHGADIHIEQGRTVQVALTKRLLSRVSRVFTLNKKMNAIVSRYTPDYEMLPCSVDTDFFRPGDDPDEGKAGKLIVFPGSPSVPVKDFPLFQRVIALLQERTDEQIRFAVLEKLSRAGVRDLMQGADCLLMTSISEGSPQAVKEALSCGLPVVSVNVGDVASMTAGVPRCSVVDDRDPERLATAVLSALDGERDAVRQAFIAKGVYDHQSISRRWAEVYTHTVNEKQSR